jgi:hypothetical protein
MKAAPISEHHQSDRVDIQPTPDGVYVEVEATRILATTARNETMRAIRSLRQKRLFMMVAAAVASVATLALAAGTSLGLKVGSAWPMLTAGVFLVATVWSLFLKEAGHEDDFGRMLEVCAVAAEQLRRVVDDGLERPAKAAALIQRFRPQLRRIAAEHAGQAPAEMERLSQSIAAKRAKRTQDGATRAFRRYERIVPKKRMAIIHLENGDRARARIIDMSRSGVATATTLDVECGARARIGSREAIVVRKVDGGVVLQFVETIPSEQFTDRFRL